MNKASTDNLLLMGKVIRPHGLQGLLRIISYAQSEDSFLKAGSIFLRSTAGETHEYKVISVRPHKKICFMRLKGLTSLEEAENYKGASILIRKDSLSRRNSDEYYWHELIGLRVQLRGGKYIGTIRDILPTGSNDIYVVRKGKKEFLIPAIHDVVEEIDLSNTRMIISDMEGLLDLNEV